MIQLGSTALDTAPIWTMVVLMTRLGGMFESLPGIGSDEFGPQFRYMAVILVALALTYSGVRAPEVDGYLPMFAVLASEFALGFLLGSIPSYTLSALAVAGQVVAGSIGLGQANLIDRSLGGNTSVISKIQVMVATAVFLAVDGHHPLLRAASGAPGTIAFGVFSPDIHTARLLTAQLSHSFELALSVAGPVLVTTLVTQFVLGLVTKFIPQVNIFIISLPLTLLVGLFLIAFCIPGMLRHCLDDYAQIEEMIGRFTEGERGVPAAPPRPVFTP